MQHRERYPIQVDLPAGNYLLTVPEGGGHRIWNADYVMGEQIDLDLFITLNQEADRDKAAALTEMGDD